MLADIPSYHGTSAMRQKSQPEMHRHKTPDAPQLISRITRVQNHKGKRRPARSCMLGTNSPSTRCRRVSAGTVSKLYRRSAVNLAGAAQRASIASIACRHSELPRHLCNAIEETTQMLRQKAPEASQWISRLLQTPVGSRTTKASAVQRGLE